jgi:hypothetical protein
MVNPTPTSFYADGTVYDEAEVVTNDHPSSSQASASPSSFFTDGGLVGAEDVTHSDVAPSDTPSSMPSSFFTDGGLVGADTVTNNDNVPDNSPRPAPTSFYPDGNLYDFLSQESAVVALLQQLAATTTTNANAAASSASNASTSEAHAAASAAQAATAVQGAAGTATPIVDGTAAVGASTKWAHEDHVHPTDASRASVTALGLKADKTYVDTQDAAGKTYTDAQVAPKADTTYVDTQDALKADKTYVDTQDALKADKTYVDTQDAKAVRFDAAQSLTAAQQLQARTNVNIGTGAGQIGEQISASGSTTNLVTGVAQTCCSLSFPVGTWDVQWFVAFAGAGGTATSDWTSQLSSAPNSVSTGNVIFLNLHTRMPNANDYALVHTHPTARITVGPSAQTLYLCAQAQVNAGTVYVASGYLRAVRVSN